MKNATIIRHKSEDPFARIPKSMLDDQNLSWKAKGILCYLLGKPDDWKARTMDIQRHGVNGGSSVQTGLKELRKTGYAKLERVTERGRVTGWLLHISDSPVYNGQNTKKPDVENPLLEKPDVENRSLTKNESTKNEKKTKNEEKEITPADAGDVAKPKSEPVAEKPKAPVKVFAEKWWEAYKRHTGMPYSPPNRAADFAAAKRITSNGRSVAELIELAEFAWEPGNLEQFYWSQAQSIAGFASRLTNIQAAFVAKRGRKLSAEEREENVRNGQAHLNTLADW